MIPKRIDGATHLMTAPPDWEAEKNGPCGSLAIRVVDNVFQSAWEPTPAELDALNRGGSIVLSIVGGQPPVALSVEAHE